MQNLVKWYHDGNPVGLKFHFTDDEDPLSALFIGSEIEMETDGKVNCEKLAFKIHREFDFDFCHFEIDKSLKKDHGVEIITQPMTLNYALNGGFQKVARVIQLAKGCGYCGNHETCGLHFHISRTDFLVHTEDIIWKLVNKFHKEFTMLSGRSNLEKMEKYARFIPNSVNKFDQETRYYAMNLFPLNTVEFRFPAGLDKTYEWMGFAEIFSGFVDWARKKNYSSRVLNQYDFEKLRNVIPEWGLPEAEKLLKRVR